MHRQCMPRVVPKKEIISEGKRQFKVKLNPSGLEHLKLILQLCICTHFLTQKSTKSHAWAFQ